MAETDDGYPADLLHGMFAKLAVTGTCEGPVDLYAEGMSDFYDRFMTEYVADVPIFEEFAGSNGVLDLASGAGRISIHLARNGHAVDGLELSQAMLALAAENLAAEAPDVAARVRFVEGDMTAFDLGRQYGLVILGITSISLLLEQPARISLFECVAAHLAPGGTFIFDVLDFEDGRWRKFDHFIDVWAVPTAEEFDIGIVGQRVYPDRGRFIFNVFRETGRWDGTVERRLGVSEKAILLREPLERELAAAGLTIFDSRIVDDQRYFFARRRGSLT